MSGLSGLRIIRFADYSRRLLVHFYRWEIMLMKHILNLAAVFKQHSVFNDASRLTNITYSPIYVQGVGGKGGGGGGNACSRSHGHLN